MASFLISFVVWAVLHSVTAASRPKTIIRQTIGEAAYAGMYRFLYNLFAVVTILPVLYLLATQVPATPVWTIAAPFSFIIYGIELIGLVGLVSISLSSCLIIYSEPIYRAARRIGLARLLAARVSEEPEEREPQRSGHIIVVGMNTLGRQIAGRLVELGERVLAVDTDPHKLAGLPCDTLLGSVEYLSVLEEAGLPRASLLVSALRIEPTNDLLAYRCHSYGVPCSVNVVDLSVTDNLVRMDVKYLIIPKIDGIKLQAQFLKESGYLKA